MAEVKACMWTVQPLRSVDHEVGLCAFQLRGMAIFNPLLVLLWLKLASTSLTGGFVCLVEDIFDR